MTIKNAPMTKGGKFVDVTPEMQRLRRKADQEWDMAGLARQDNDKKDEERRTALARKYEAQLREEILRS